MLQDSDNRPKLGGESGRDIATAITGGWAESQPQNRFSLTTLVAPPYRYYMPILQARPSDSLCSPRVALAAGRVKEESMSGHRASSFPCRGPLKLRGTGQG